MTRRALGATRMVLIVTASALPIPRQCHRRRVTVTARQSGGAVDVRRMLERHLSRTRGIGNLQRE